MEKKKRKKYGGRKKGTPNLITTELRQRISDLIDNNFDQLQTDIDKLEPKERVETIIKLFEYSLPKLQRLDITGPTFKRGEIDIPDLELTDEEREVLLKIGENILNQDYND